MNRERWRRVSPHLDRALELSEEGRQRVLAELALEDPALAADLEQLLTEERQLRAEKFLEHDAQDLLVAEPLEGQRLGAYTLLRPLGAGGMGSVWLARRTDGHFEGTVAIKLLSAAFLGAAGASRFRREGSILARLKHPHIAQLLDAGLSEAGQPYLVLEFVEGAPIDRWCDEQALGLEARLRLFLDVLAAVAHAHANLVVHRDLKPSNVMVSREGEVKLLDFGIATLLQAEGEDGAAAPLTRDAGRAFTPAFAAPEQVTGGAITTVTDVYALGALLYRLLAGRNPTGDAEASPAALVRAIVETDPDHLSDVVLEPRSTEGQTLSEVAAQRATTPERLRRALRGDLDTLVAKALKKRPEERYPSVTALADDVRRFLDGKPLTARPDSWGYRTVKFARRHARSLAAAGLAGLALLGVVAFYTVRLAAERDRVQLEAERATQVKEFLGDLLTHTDPFEAGSSGTTVQDLLNAGATRARQELSRQPELQRQLLTLLGKIDDRRGATALALPLLREAVDLARKTSGASSGLAQSLLELGVVLGNRPQDDSGRVALEEALALQLRFLGPEHPDVATARSELGRVYLDSGRLAEAETQLRAALQIRRKLFGAEDHETAMSLSDVGMLLRRKGERAAAEATLREALALMRRTRPKNHPEIAMSLTRLGLTVNERGDHRAAELLFRQAVDIARRTLGPHHTDYAQMLANLGGALRLEGRLSEAAAKHEEAVAIVRSALGADEPLTGGLEIQLARTYLDQGRPAAAEPLLLHALTLQQSTFSSPEDWRIGVTQSLLGAAYTQLARYPESEARLLRARAILRPTADATSLQSVEAAATRERLATLYRAWGRPQNPSSLRP